MFRKHLPEDQTQQMTANLQSHAGATHQPSFSGSGRAATSPRVGVSLADPPILISLCVLCFTPRDMGLPPQLHMG